MYINEYLLGKWLSREKFVFNPAPITQIHLEFKFWALCSHMLCCLEIIVKALNTTGTLFISFTSVHFIW